MDRVLYGVWNGKVINNRDQQSHETQNFEELKEFTPGKETTHVIGPWGFLVFDENSNLIQTMISHLQAAFSESCGKCTPCRAGLKMLIQKLNQAKKSPLNDDEIADMRELADHIHQTSLCGVGQTSTIALLGLLDHFPQILKEKPVEPNKEKFFSYTTAPCIEACPAKVDVPKYIDYIKNGTVDKTLGVIFKKYPFPGTCARVCNRFCEEGCRRDQIDQPVAIKVLKRFAADYGSYIRDNWFKDITYKNKKTDGKKIAVIGSGPAGIGAAYHLLLKGYRVDIYEARKKGGGMADNGIPDYRLPQDILHEEIDIIEKLGANFYYEQALGKDFSIADLKKKGYDSIFIGIGAANAKSLRAENEDQCTDGYMPGLEFLDQVQNHLDYGTDIKIGKKIVVVGGGNVAMDCVRTAKRLGVEEVHLVYRRAKEQMPADPEEIEAAEHEKITFHYLTNPTKLNLDHGKLVSLELIKMELGEPDQSGRKRVSPIKGSEFTLETDFVIPAIGQAVDKSAFKDEKSLELTEWGTVKADDDTLMTSIEGVFSGGDCVVGPDNLTLALAQGELAAINIDQYIQTGKVGFNPIRKMQKFVEILNQGVEDKLNKAMLPSQRSKNPESLALERIQNFEEVEHPINQKQAYEESSRCMRCYRIYSVSEK